MTLEAPRIPSQHTYPSSLGEVETLQFRLVLEKTGFVLVGCCWLVDRPAYKAKGSKLLSMELAADAKGRIKQTQ
eukprot:scaffold104592_cov14-Tisochrysis_lutea.AAC.1